MSKDQDWVNLEGSELAGAICALVDGLADNQRARQDEQRDCVNRYECRRLTSLDPHAYVDEPGSDIKLAYPLERSLVNTVHAELTKTRLKPRLLTTGADWNVQRRALRLQKFVVGQMHVSQGAYHDAWDVMNAAWRDVEICGEGYVYIYPDYERGCVAIERLLPWQVGVDPTDAEYGNPGTYWRAYSADKRRLECLFVDGDPDANEDEKAMRKHAIAAAEIEYRTTAEALRMSPRCKVREIWRVGSKGEPGKHVVTVDGYPLFVEDYPYPEPPIVPMRWNRHVMGWGGTGLVYEASMTSDALNYVLDRIIAGYRIRSGRRTYYHEGTVAEEHLQSNEDETFIPVQQGAQFPVPEVIPALQPGEIELASIVRQWGHEGTGVSMMAAMSRKEEGLNSGRAIRTAKDLGTARFMPQAVHREDCFKTLFRLIIRCARELAEENPGLLARWPGQEFIREVEWKRADIDDDMYVVEIDTENASATDTAGRTATLEEGMASGMVSADTFARLTSGTLDLDQESSAVQSERQYLEDLIDRYLDAEEDDEDFEFEGPEGFCIDKAGALTLFIRAYWDAKRKGAPAFNLELLRRWIVGMDRLVQRLAQAGSAPGSAGVAAPPPAPGGAAVTGA